MIKRVLLLLTLCLPILVNSQNFRFNQYSIEDGISQNFIYSLSQDQNGYLWAGTGEGLCHFDGRSFTTYGIANGLAENAITSSYEDKFGQLWFGHIEGGITRYAIGEFNALPKNGRTASPVNAICGVGKTTFYLTQNEGIFSILDDKVTPVGQFNMDEFYSIGSFTDSNVIAGTGSGLLHVVKDAGTWKLETIYFETSAIKDISPSTTDEASYILLLENGEIHGVKLVDGVLKFREWEHAEDYSDFSFQTLLQDPSGDLWVGTHGSGMLKFDADQKGGVTHYSVENGMSSEFVRSLLCDREGNIWIGTFGAGLSTLIDDFFTFYTTDKEVMGRGVYAFETFGADQWRGVENGLVRQGPGVLNGQEFYTDTSGLAHDMVSALCIQDSIVWIGTDKNGLYTYDYRTNICSKANWDFGSLGNSINAIVYDKERLWLATEAGVVIFDPASATSMIINTEFGLAHNSINDIYKATDGQIWIATKSRFIYSVKGDELIEHEFAGYGEADVVSLSEDDEGNIWFATAENGVYKFDGEIFRAITTESGLKSDYCYALSPLVNGSFWVGHRGGLSQIDIRTIQVKTFDHKAGITDQVSLNAMHLDDKNELWIGTETGLIKYDFEKDLENEAGPIINLLSIVIGDKTYLPSDEIVLPYGSYRIHFDYVGVSFKHPEKVRYRYMLEGYDDVFSDPTAEATTSYGRISEGTYIFNVTACNEDGYCSELPVQFRIEIKVPIWKQWWFYAVLFLSIVSIVYGAIRLRVKRLIAQGVELQKQLAIKTREVVLKADKIEEINKDLTDSINYAERIQKSILPNESVLSDEYPRSFIFFAPRDVVSGDFYFIKKIGTKLIVCCADCTGHGVPGAFMSMIGSVVLKNIYENSRFEWQKPDQVLEQLDREVQSILNQKKTEDPEEAFFQSRDGMDLTLCEIDTETNTVLLASAMRTSLIYRNNELESIPGVKRSIGGDNPLKKDYRYDEFHMNAGEALYLFSDGFPDQFGGPEGRKLQLSGTKGFIETAQALDSEDQGPSIGASFMAWHSDWIQIDDVLMIGIMF
jgi:ligand-binding sensor domain-containing protein/serine phosphatase RsbU (regulator of sigma subunit)